MLGRAKSLGRKVRPRRWHKSRRRSLPLLHSLLHLLLFLLSTLEAGAKRLPLLLTPPYWQTGRTSWAGPWCQWVDTAAGVDRNREGGEGMMGGRGGRVWRGRHKRESRLGEELRLAFLSLSFIFEPQSRRLRGFKQQLSEHLEPRLRFCRNAEAHRCVLHDPSQARRRLFV